MHQGDSLIRVGSCENREVETVETNFLSVFVEKQNWGIVAWKGGCGEYGSVKAGFLSNFSFENIEINKVERVKILK